MGNHTSTHQFPCQICGIVYQRELSGSLLCKECSLNNKFNMLIEPEEKNKLISKFMTFPLYIILKQKNINIDIKSDLEYKFHKNVVKQLNQTLSNTIYQKRYHLIKYILQHLDSCNFMKENQLKGIYFYEKIESLDKNILFIHDPNIKDMDRVLYLNFGDLVKNLSS